MRLLLDTHTLLWSVFQPEKLSAAAREAIADPHHVIFISIASLWEIAIKVSIGKLTIPANFFDNLPNAGFETLPLTPTHIHRYTTLPLHHRDPFDRILVAQTLEEQLILITADEAIPHYGVSMIQA